MTAKDLVRFFSHVQRVGECWQWTASTSGRGKHLYGRFFAGGRAASAHRFAFWHWKGEVPEGHELDHTCRNTLCVNPLHLDAVPHVVNVRRGASCQESGFYSLRTYSEDGHRRLMESNRRPENIKRLTEISHARTADTFAKIAAGNRGKRMSDEAKEKISRAMRGRPKSMETRARMSDAMRRRWERKRSEAA